MSQEYTCGFMFSKDLKVVALIHKNRPDWQSGRINGIGGSIEAFTKLENGVSLDCPETPLQAMVREFYEETNVYFDNFKEFCYLHDDIFNKKFGVHFFYGISDNVYKVDSKTDELVALYPTDKLPKDVLPNLRWLIPLALTVATGEESANRFDIEEIK